jgi:hypothetical protein
MTDRLVGAVPGASALHSWQGWTGFQQNDPHARQIAAGIEADRLARIGRELLGWREQTFDQQGQIIVVWRQVAAESVAGLPAHAVDPARAATQAEDAARRDLAAAQQRFYAWQREHNPRPELASIKAQEFTIEADTALRKAEAVAVRALAELGRVAEIVAQARAALTDAPRARQAAEAQYRAAVEAIVQSEHAARQQLEALGVS